MRRSLLALVASLCFTQACGGQQMIVANPNPIITQILASAAPSTIVVGQQAILAAVDEDANNVVYNQIGNSGCIWISDAPSVFTIAPGTNVAVGASLGTGPAECDFGGLVGFVTITVVGSPQFQNPPINCASPCALTPPGVNGSPYSYTFAAVGGVPPYTTDCNGSCAGLLPAGLSLNSSTGVLSGTPTVNGTTTWPARICDSGSNCTPPLNVSLTVSGSSCGPPNYSCSSTSTGQYTGYPTPLSPIFTSESPINATNVDATLNPSFNCYTVLATTGVGDVTDSGGDNDVDWSALDSYLALKLQGGVNVLYNFTTVASTANCPNGAVQLVNVPSYLTSLYCKTGTSCSETNLAAGHPNTTQNTGAYGFSRKTDTTFYFMHSYSQLWQMTLTSNNAITTQLLFDFGAVGNCPEITNATGPAKSGSILGIAGSAAAGDIAFATLLSFTGGQDTAIQGFIYRPGVGCKTINAFTGNWYAFCNNGNCQNATPAGTETLCNNANNPAGHGLHNAQISLDGNWLRISNANPFIHNTGSSTICTSSPAEFYITWGVSPTNGGTVFVTNGATNADNGHPSDGYTHIVQTNNPSPNIRLISNPLSYTQFYQFPAGMPGSIHGAWSHSAADDVSGSANVWWIVTANHPVGNGLSDTVPTKFTNEVFGLFPNAVYPPGGTPIRGGHTFTDQSCTSFGGLNAISDISQSGKFIFFGTSMLGQWGGCGAVIQMLQ
jgi:hypothetical protein